FGEELSLCKGLLHCLRALERPEASVIRKKGGIANAEISKARDSNGADGDQQQQTAHQSSLVWSSLVSGTAVVW
ncbi:unnamed protein product, partial [Ectocarpus sp. 13 AM-2016]